mmetsp:Transcript_36045/g.41023  ORF Transcript_36045/g.41023 Transcript_36045/m.41023 type:complete len:168 (+) Transcript_36045:228-731(+)
MQNLKEMVKARGRNKGERERGETQKSVKEGRNSGNSILGGNLPRENRKGKKSKISFIDDFICICEEFASNFANTESVQRDEHVNERGEEGIINFVKQTVKTGKVYEVKLKKTASQNSMPKNKNDCKQRERIETLDPLLTSDGSIDHPLLTSEGSIDHPLCRKTRNLR